MMTRRVGSAMLIAMLVVSIISAVGFGVVGITIRQLRQQGSVAASTRAYQAAEAGLEYGLLQYRLAKTARLGEGAEAVDALGVSWPSTPLTISLLDDQSFTVRTTNRYQWLGGYACLSQSFSTADQFRTCDGQGGRTLARLKPGDTLRVSPTSGSSKYLYLRGLTDQNGSTTNGFIVVTGYTDSGGQVGTQSVWRLNDPGNPIAPQSGFKLASADLAAASWFTVRYLNDSSTDRFLLAVGVSQRNDNASVTPLAFTTDRYLIEVIGRAGGVAGVQRQLQAVVNSRENTVDALYDHNETAFGTMDYILSGGSIVIP